MYSVVEKTMLERQLEGTSFCTISLLIHLVTIIYCECTQNIDNETE